MHARVDPPTLQQAAEAGCRAGLRAGLPEPEARDLAQDALVRALSSAQPPAGVSLPAWVYGIARNLGRDHAKSAKRRELLVGEPHDEAAPAEDMITVLAVRRAVHELPEPLREVVTLHELEEHSLRETALALQIPFDTAKDRLRRAREQLRARLDDRDPAWASERSRTRRRAARYGAAIAAAVAAALGDRAIAVAAPGEGAVAAGAKTATMIRGWVAALAGGALLAGGFAAGRLTAPASERAAPVVAIEAASAPVMATNPAATPAEEREPESEPEHVVANVPAAPIVLNAERSTSQPATSRSPTPRAPDSRGQAERLLLDRARAGLQRGLPDEALVTLMSHARQFPAGMLAEERDVLIIEAYLRAGNAVVARRRIERYRVHHPAGVLRARVDAAAAAAAL